MKTILTRTALAALAVASLGFAACSAGVEATPQDAAVNNGGSQSAPVQTNSPAAQQSEDRGDTTVDVKVGSGGVTAPGVTVGPGGVTAPGVTVGPGGVSAPGATVGPGGVSGSSDSEDSNAGNTENARSVDCDKDSVVDETGTVVRFSGHCDSITIDAVGAVVYYESVGRLTIKQTGSVTQGGDISRLEISGSSNSVTVNGDLKEAYLSGVGNAVSASGTVGKVSDTGTGNAVN